MIRRDQEHNVKFLALKKSVEDGLESGVSERSIAEIWDEAKQRSLASQSYGGCSRFCFPAVLPVSLRESPITPSGSFVSSKPAVAAMAWRGPSNAWPQTRNAGAVQDNFLLPAARFRRKIT